MGDGQAEVSGGWCNVMLSQGSLEMFGFVVTSDFVACFKGKSNLRRPNPKQH